MTNETGDPVDATPNPSTHIRVPTTPGEVDDLLHDLPVGWEYPLFAGVIRVGLDALEPKYFSYEMEYAPRTGEAYEGEAAFRFLGPFIQHMGAIIEMLDRVFDQDVHLRAFGEPGEMGDPKRIEHLGLCFVRTYEELLDQASRILGATISDEFKQAQRAAARLGSNAVSEMRDFAAQLQRAFEALPGIADARDVSEEDEPLEVLLTCRITANEEANAELIEGLRRGVEHVRGE